MCVCTAVLWENMRHGSLGVTHMCRTALPLLSVSMDVHYSNDTCVLVTRPGQWTESRGRPTLCMCTAWRTQPSLWTRPQALLLVPASPRAECIAACGCLGWARTASMQSLVTVTHARSDHTGCGCSWAGQGQAGPKARSAVQQCMLAWHRVGGRTSGAASRVSILRGRYVCAAAGGASGVNSCTGCEL
jgi:hypothetical protein